MSVNFKSWYPEFFYKMNEKNRPTVLMSDASKIVPNTVPKHY